MAKKKKKKKRSSARDRRRARRNDTREAARSSHPETDWRDVMAQKLPGDDDPPLRIWSPDDKRKLTMGGRLTGRISLKQQAFLEELGVPRSDSMGWTKDRASKEIDKRLRKQRRE